jgi:hypothetical protein
MKIRQIVLSFLLLVSASSVMYGQTDVFGLKLYGFYQTSFMTDHQTLNTPYAPSQDLRINSFWMQQMNLFLTKDINDYFTTFVSLEFTNNYASQKNWGSFSIEEAWIRYSSSSLLNIKGGLFLPAFNNLNEIKDRTLLLPYILRPFAYETSLGSLVDLNAYVPQNANLEVYGSLLLQDLKLNYVVYVGNSEDEYANDNTTPQGVAGLDTSKFKLVGGRIGVDYENLKMGISSTFDKTNQAAYKIGDVSRSRFGADLSYSIAGFKLETEYIKVKCYLNDGQKGTLNLLHTYVSPAVPVNMDKEFYYAVLSYNITDELFIYGKYDNERDQANFLMSSGVKGYSGGGGYKAADDILLKFQYQDAEIDNGNIAKISYKAFLIGASILF